MKITQNCIINGMPEEVYHNDPTPEQAEGFQEYTSLSSTVALAMIEKTPIEARMKINRLNPELEKKKNSDAINLGSMVHDKVLLKGNGKNLYEIVPFPDFRTSDAKERRDDLISRGIIPLAKNKKTEELLKSIDTMEARLHEQLAEHMEYPGLMSTGQGEQSGFYFDQEIGIWKRARFDWLDEKYSDIIWDYKTTSLELDQWINNDLWKEKYIQAPHYKSVYNGITGQKNKFGFIVQRSVDPFIVAVVVIDESYLDMVSDRYKVAETKFVECLKTGKWAGGSRFTQHSCPPPWIVNKWESDALNLELEQEAQKQDKPDTYMAG